MSIGSAEFAENSIVDVLIPEASSVGIEEALAASEAARDEDDSALITSVSQRTLLFFDEKLPLYVVLRTPYQDETQLKVYITRLHIVLEAHAISSQAHASHSADSLQGHTGNQPRDVIWSGKVDVLEDPVIVVEESEEDNEDDRTLLVLWKLTSFLTRPRTRLQSPAIIFKLSASLQPLSNSARTGSTDPYLPSGVPIQSSVFQPLQDDPALRGVTQRPSGSKASSYHASISSIRSETLPLKTVSKKAIHALPAISARMRYHRSNSISNNSAVVASLDVEVPVFSSSQVELQSIKLQFNDGKVEDLVVGRTIIFPIVSQPRDSTAFLYRLQLAHAVRDNITIASGVKVLEVAIDAEVLVSSVCRPNIQMRWRTNVDFSTALNPNFSKPGQSIQRDHRPRSLPTTMASTFVTNGSGPSTTKSPHERPFPNIGIAVTFTATKEVHVGEPFCWEVLIVNRSKQSRNLAIIVIPKSRGPEARKTTSRPSSSTSNSGSMAGTIADAVVDENLLYAAMKAAQSIDEAHLVCLTTDIKIGPLSPGSCYTTEIKFLPLARGYLHVGAVRIVDVTSNDSVDIRELPDIEALDRVSDD